jgi:hypothetical protein
MKSKANRAFTAKKKLTALLMTLLLMSTALWAEETVTVSAKSTDISEGLDLKVVAKLFAEAENLEQFEMKLNQPDSAFCNLDLNGDGEVDYLRVVETGEGNKRLIVLQAVLAKDIYQDVASIYVEKDEKDVVSVQVVGDEYVYGTNYVIEPVYIYRPVIYDWFWSDAWYAWHSPWYWGYWPGWWYAHHCWAHDWYWHHCYAYHHCHHWCTFRHAAEPSRGYHDLRGGVSRRDYAAIHPTQSFSVRNSGMTNARDIRSTTSVRPHQTAVAQRSGAGSVRGESMRGSGAARSATSARAASATATRSAGNAASARSTTYTAKRSTSATATHSTSATRSTSATATRSTGTATSSRTTATASRSTGSATRTTGTRSTSSTIRQPQRSTSSSSGTRSTTYSGSTRSGGSTYSGGSSSSSRSGGSTYSGGSSRSGGGGYSGGSSRGGGGYSGGGGSRGGGGGGSVRR